MVNWFKQKIFAPACECACHKPRPDLHDGKQCNWSLHACHPSPDFHDAAPCSERVRNGCGTLLCSFCTRWAHHMHWTAEETAAIVARNDADPNYNVFSDSGNWLR